MKKETRDQKPKEHKQPWQDKYASPEEIQQMLDERVLLRYNEVRGRTEIHYLSQGPVIGENELGLLTIFGGEGGVSDGYDNLSDRDVNSLWKEMSRQKPIIKAHLQNVIESDYVPRYHPFRYYLEHLPPWSEEQDDAIMDLAMTIRLKGDEYESARFYQYLKKWLVGMVASWVDEAVVNNVMLVLIGEQGAYKTTWFAHLLPPQLRSYFYTKTNSGLVSKDDLITLSQYGLMCWEELDSMQQKELNKLKAAMTMPSINERAAYARYHENRPHIASFCGTGNNVQFLSDTTGTRRWLPFEVESIESPLTAPFNHDAIYAQAYALYREGFQYWFDRDEIEALQRHNEHFETPRSEYELIDEHFRKPMSNTEGEYLPASIIIQQTGGVNMKGVTTQSIGRALTAMGFEYKMLDGIRRYHVVRRNTSEIQLHRQGGESVEVF
jgi:hypothetical protein